MNIYQKNKIPEHLQKYFEPVEMGLEKTPEEFVENLVNVFKEIWRVLKPDGTIWVVIGDSYNGSCSTGGTKSISSGGNLRPSGRSQPQQAHLNRKDQTLKPKDLIGTPWMLAFALRADGWYLRQSIIWSKGNNPMPESVTDRCTKSHEYIFMLSKQPKYYYDNIAIQEKSTTFENRPPGIVRDRLYNYDSKQKVLRNINGQMSKNGVTRTTEGLNLKSQEEKTHEFRNKRDVWVVNTKPYPHAHFATYSNELIRPCILAGCPIGGTVLDPFCGSGTTGEEAIFQKRKFIGIDLKKEYLVKYAKPRLIRALKKL